MASNPAQQRSRRRSLLRAISRLALQGFPNIAWLNGNDFNSWKNLDDDAVVQAAAKGIKSTDPGHLQTVELNVFTSSSLDDPTWAPLISLNKTYTYSATYIQMLHSYNQTPVVPAYTWL